MNQNQSRKIEILMFPWLAHGHISPFLELAKRLSAKNLNVYFCSTPVNLSSIKVKLGEKHSKSLKLVEFHLPTLPDLPPDYHTTKSLPPELMPKLKQAFDIAKPNFSKILEELKPDLVIIFSHGYRKLLQSIIFQQSSSSQLVQQWFLSRFM